MSYPFERPKVTPTYSFDELCIKCGTKLRRLDIGLYKKMINRGAEEFMCVDCLSEKIGVPKEQLLEKAEQFKKMGCILFN